MAGDRKISAENGNAKIEPRKPVLRWLALGAGAVFLLALGVLERRWWTLNDITTGQTPEYPDLPSHIYAADTASVRKVAEAACTALPRWRIVPAASMDNETPPLQAEVRTALFSFIDDVTVRFEPVTETSGTAPQTRVVIRSHSRVGKGDLGENERHIRALQREMDARLPRVSTPR